MGRLRAHAATLGTGLLILVILVSKGTCPAMAAAGAPPTGAPASGGASRVALPDALPVVSLWVAGRAADDSGPSLLVDGTLLIPVRALERAGVKVEWRAQERTVWMRRGERWAAATVGSSWMQTASGSVTLPLPPAIYSGRLVVPARSVAEPLGLTVRWDSGLKRASLEPEPEPGRPPVAPTGEVASRGPGRDRRATASSAATAPPASPAPAGPGRAGGAAAARAYRPSPRPSPPPVGDPAAVGTLLAVLPAPIGPRLQPPTLLPASREAPAETVAPSVPQETKEVPGTPDPPGEVQAQGATASEPVLPSEAHVESPPSPAPPETREATAAAPAGQEEQAPPAAPQPAESTGAKPAAAPASPPFRPRELDGLVTALSRWAVAPEPPALAPGLQRSGVFLPPGLAPGLPATLLTPPASPGGLLPGPGAGAEAPRAPSAPSEPARPAPAGAPGRSAPATSETASPGTASPQRLSQILGVQVRRSGGRPRIEVLRDGPVTVTQPAILADPPRLVFDLAGARLAAPVLEYDVDGPILRRVRLGQQSPDTVRVAVDLNALVGYSLAEGSESTTVFINHQVAGVRWIPDPPTARSPASGQLWIEMSGYAPIRTGTLDNPRRLVIDVQEATLTVPASEWAVSSGPVTRVRVSQHQPDVVRVVLELASPVRPRVVTSADLARQGLEAGGAPPPPASGSDTAVPLDVVLDVYSRIRRLSLSPVSRSGVSLVVEATGPLQPRTFYLREPDRLVVDFPGAVLEPQAGGPQGEFPGQGPVRALRTGQFLPRAARLVLELDNPVSHRIFRSEEGSMAVVALGSEPLVGRTVAIDPGHGGTDTGAIGTSGTPEKFYNLDLARRLAKLLESLGVEVTMTRTDDVFVSLDERVEIARRAGAEVLVSIHHNASTSGLGMGTEVLYSPRLPASRLLAELLYDALVSQLNTQGRGVKARSDLRVLRMAPMPAALVEVAFVDHPADEQRLQDAAFRQSAAEALFSGLVSFFSATGNANAQQTSERRPALQAVGRVQ